MAKTKIKYGKTDLIGPNDLDIKNAKVLISIRLDGDVLEAIKSAATASGQPYQSMINKLLRERFVVEPERITLAEAMAKIREIEDRMGAIEGAKGKRRVG